MTLILMKKKVNDQILRDRRYNSLKKQMKMKAIEYGLSFEEFKEINRMAGILNKTRTLIEEEGFDRDTATALMFELNKLMSSYEREEHKECVLSPQAIETLKKLKKDSHDIGIVTNTSESELLKIFNRFGIEKYVDAYITRDNLRYVKPYPDSLIEILGKLNTSRFFYIGDSDHDAEAVKRALRLGKNNLYGKFLLINTRRYDEKALASMKPYAVIQSLNEIFPLLIKNSDNNKL